MLELQRAVMSMPSARWNKYYATYTEEGASGYYDTGPWSAEEQLPWQNWMLEYDDYVYPANTTTGRFSLAGVLKGVGYTGGVWTEGTVFTLSNDGRTITKHVFRTDQYRGYFRSSRSSYFVGTPGVWTWKIGSFIGLYKERFSDPYPSINVAANGHVYVGEGWSGGKYYIYYRDSGWTYYRAYTKA